jgi:signal transduction histidine kinase
VVVRDITARKARERNLQEAKTTIEEQRDTLSVVAQVVRHDIRNNLQLVRSYADLIEERSDEEAEFIGIIEERADEAIELTNTARNLSAVVLQSENPTERVWLAQTVRQQIDEVQSSYPEAEITLEGDQSGVPVLADAMIDSLVRNLLQNAIQHNDAETPRVQVSIREDDDEAEVRVADNGPGVPDEMKETIFGKGEKGLDSAGTGLGLYLARALAESYGGDVWVEDNEPRGAVFVVRLQRAE